MNAASLQTYLQSLRGEWEYPADTVDTFKAGDPATEIRGIAVGWTSYSWALERALALGCNVFITHEPTYYEHRDNDPAIFRFDGPRRKRQWVEENEMVILRCHDMLDQLPEIGIPDTWGDFLALGKAVDGDDYLRVYSVDNMTAGEVARHVAARVRPLGQDAVQLIGPVDKVVNRICTGTGAETPFQTYLEKFQADLAVCTDDGMWYWRDGAFAIDHDIPIIVVNHAVSEEIGMKVLAEHLQAQFPDIPVHHIPQRCMYRLVQAEPEPA